MNSSNNITSSIRSIDINDIIQLKEIIDKLELFPSELLNDMMKNYFHPTDLENPTEFWITTELQDSNTT